HQKISDIHCSPVAETAACTVRSVDRDKDGYASFIWLFPLDGGPDRAVQLTQGSGSDNSPQWSPDGEQLAFLSGLGGSATQAYVIGCRGGEARQVGQFPQSVTNLKWTPDGRSLIVASAVTVDPDRHGARSSEPAPPRAAKAPEVAWRLPYKEDGIGFILQREIHLFSLDVASGEHRQLTDGAFDVVAFDVSRDGQRIAYARTRSGRFGHRYDLWVCDASGQNHRQLTSDHAIVMEPTWSPDGSRIAFTGALEEGDAEPALWLLDCADGQARRLGDVDVADPASLRWADDGKSIVFCRAHRGRHQVARIDTGDGQRLDVLLGGDRQLGAFDCTGKTIAFAPEHPSLASELRVVPIAGGEERQVSRLNAWWESRPVIGAEVRSFEVPDGQGGTERIEGWLLYRQRDEGKAGPMPLLNDIHGGPASYALMDFDTNVFWQVLCANGWAVLALNAVGSSSFGHEFCRRLSGHWGEYDLPQHLAAIRQLQDEGLCDERVAVSGKSYGGYLSAWATGHTDLFKAAVVMAPVGNIETHYGTSDGGYYADPYYLNSQPRFDRERARQLSPLQHIEKSSTPTLFMQGREDERCPKCQSEELFVSLLRAGETPGELVLYPGETHGFLGTGAPSCRRDAAERIVAWINRYCTEPGAERSAEESSTDDA
ncbi:MAG: peptidase, partial [Rhodoferax sp.]|nr:peptidase [Rhodoferax sp.]